MYTVTFASATRPRPRSLTMDNPETLQTVTPEKKKRDWWQRGRALDLWSIPHFLFGILMAMLPPLTGMPIVGALAFVIILALLWEMYEKLVGINEVPINSVSDVVLPVVAFTFTSLILRSYQFHSDDIIVVAIAVLLLYLFTNISGWLAYRRRVRDFTH